MFLFFKFFFEFIEIVLLIELSDCSTFDKLDNVVSVNCFVIPVDIRFFYLFTICYLFSIRSIILTFIALKKFMSDQSLVQRVPLLSSCSGQTENEEIKEKRCLIHIKYLSIMIAMIELSIVFYQIMNGNWQNSENSLIFIMSTILFLVVIILLFLAILFDIAVLLIPHLAMQFLLAVCFFSMALFSLYAIFTGASLHVLLVVSNPEQSSLSIQSLPEPMVSSNMVSGFLMGSLVLFVLFYISISITIIWCLRIIQDCYRYLKQQRKKQQTPSEEEYCAPRTIQLSMYPNQIVQATDF